MNAEHAEDVVGAETLGARPAGDIGMFVNEQQDVTARFGRGDDDN
jgi:hypothetical protein